MAAGAAGSPGAGTGAAPITASPVVTPGAVPTAAITTTPPVVTDAPPGSSTGTQYSNADNIAVLRQSHELVKKLGGEQAITTLQQTAERHTKVTTAYKSIATELGFTPESFDEAFASDPQDVIDYLHEEMAKAPKGGGDGRGDGDLNALLDARLKPLEMQARKQAATEANQRVEGEFNRLFDANDLFRGKNVPKDVKDGLFNFFADSLKYEPQVLQNILQGKTDGIEKVFQSVLTGASTFINSWNRWMSGSGTVQEGMEGGTRVSPKPPDVSTLLNKPGMTPLDRIAEGDDEATKLLPSLRHFRGA